MLSKGSKQSLYKPANLEGIAERDNDPDVLTKGNLYFVKGKREETLYYTVKKAKKQIRCYKNENSVKVCRKFNLKGAKLYNQPTESTSNLSLQLKSGRVIKLLAFQQENTDELLKLFESGSSGSPLPKSFLKNLKRGCMGLVRAPIKISSGTINVLEKIGDGARKAPDVIFSSGDQKKRTKRIPRDPAQGLLFGAESIVTEVAGALIGLVTEPMKGAKAKGFKGATKGIGRGLVGLVFKPVAGTIDLVTHTARGVGTVPSAIYRNVFRIKEKSKDPKLNQKEADKNDLELVFEDEKQEVYVNKKSLSKNLLATGNFAPMSEVNTACLDYKEKYEIEREKREQLTKIMENIIQSLDPEAVNKNKELIDKALRFSEIGENAEKEEEEDSDMDENISKIIHLYEGHNNSNQDIKEELYEFFFIQAVPQKDNETKNARLSIQTNSFHDKPDEKAFKITSKDARSHITDTSSVSSAYDSDHVMNQTISAYDSDGFDGDEFKQGERRVAHSLALHTGKEGRTGPKNIVTFPRSLKKLDVNERILDDHDEGMPSLNRHLTKEIPQFSHQASILDIAVPSKHYLKSKISLGPDSEPIDITDMKQLIDLEVKIPTIKKWNYPEVIINLPYKEIEDLPNVIRMKDFEVEGREYCDLKGKELIKFLEDWKFIEDKEDCRYPYSNKKGGKIPENEKVIKKIRGIAKEFIMKVGRTVLSGNFNLTTIPFPIKASVPKSYLENIGYTPTVYYPLYLNLALKNPDPLQRFKFYIVSSISYFFLTTPFAKPLNPILGETLTGHYADGSRAYLEQISHHPPISYLLFHGPKDAYKIWGPSMFSAHAGLNSLSLTTKGWRKIQFADTNQLITSTFPNEYYEGTFWGAFLTESVGSMDFVDKENKISCQITFGSVKKKPSDYFQGTITVNGKPVSNIFGTYLGYIDIDGFRYFDYRYCKPFTIHNETSPLPSDFKYRRDFLSLKLGHIDEAQREKDTLEQLQRHDAKLRKEHDKATHTKHKGR